MPLTGYSVFPRYESILVCRLLPKVAGGATMNVVTSWMYLYLLFVLPPLLLFSLILKDRMWSLRRLTGRRRGIDHTNEVTSAIRETLGGR